MEIVRAGNWARMSVNRDPPVAGRSKGDFTSLSARGPLYVGGAPVEVEEEEKEEEAEEEEEEESMDGAQNDNYRAKYQKCITEYTGHIRVVGCSILKSETRPTKEV